MSDTRPATSPVSTDTNHVQLARGGGSVRDARLTNRGHSDEPATAHWEELPPLPPQGMHDAWEHEHERPRDFLGRVTAQSLFSSELPAEFPMG